MLESLQTIAAAYGLEWRYGESKSFNIDADALKPGTIVLYNEGYGYSGPAVEDEQGAFEFTPALRLWVLKVMGRDGLSFKPDQRSPTFPELQRLTLTRILPALSKDYTLSGVNITEAINVKDANLDGLRINVSAKPKIVQSLC